MLSLITCFSSKDSMAIHSAIPLFALTLLCSSSLAYSQVDYFRLLLVWPGGFCNNPSGPSCCRPGTESYPRFDFYVNRLIPYTRNAPSTRCLYTPFYINTLQSIIEDLNSYWPSINCPSSNGQAFWESAWRTDGICSGFGQKDYFQKALQLRKKANLLETFDWKGILPSNYKTYQLAEVERAITETYGETASIECGSPTGVSIKGIYLCVDNTATNIIKCPFKPVSNCAARVKFDPYTANMLKDQATTVSAIPTLMSVISE